MTDYKEYAAQLDDLCTVQPDELSQITSVTEDGLKVDDIALYSIPPSKLIFMILEMYPKINDAVLQAEFCEFTMRWIYEKVCKIQEDSDNEVGQNISILGYKSAADLLHSLIMDIE